MVEEIGKHDDTLRKIMEDVKDPRVFLDTVFGFLARYSDFFVEECPSLHNLGLPKGHVEGVIDNYVKIWQTRTRAHIRKHFGEPSDLHHEGIVYKEDEIGYDVAEVDDDDEEEDDDIDDQLEDDSIELEIDKMLPQPELFHIPGTSNKETHNGADCGSYWWAQTEEDLDLYVKIPTTVSNKKQVLVEHSSIHITIKANFEGKWNTLVKGDFVYPIQSEDLSWTFIAGQHIHVYLEKRNPSYWDTVLKGGSKIDKKKLDTSVQFHKLPTEEKVKIEKIVRDTHSVEQQITELEEKIGCSGFMFTDGLKRKEKEEQAPTNLENVGVDAEPVIFSKEKTTERARD